MSLSWEFIMSTLPLYQKAAWLTLKLAAGGIVLSLFIGFICSIILYYRVRVVERIVQAYIELLRNTPLLIQLFFLYYGFTKFGVTMSEYTCAIIGLSNMQIARYVIFPQAISVTIPSLGANCFFTKGNFHCGSHRYTRPYKCNAIFDRNVLSNF